jgi:hypothetical protein
MLSIPHFCSGGIDVYRIIISKADTVRIFKIFNELYRELKNLNQLEHGKVHWS